VANSTAALSATYEQLLKSVGHRILSNGNTSIVVLPGSAFFSGTFPLTD
jgi:hypothetical protein